VNHVDRNVGNHAESSTDCFHLCCRVTYACCSVFICVPLLPQAWHVFLHYLQLSISIVYGPVWYLCDISVKHEMSLSCAYISLMMMLLMPATHLCMTVILYVWLPRQLCLYICMIIMPPTVGRGSKHCFCPSVRLSVCLSVHLVRNE